jgi:tetratricopeptide (TPR) repeat protein
MDVERHGTSLTFRINDFIPGSLFLVQSALYPISERDFKTDISNVSVSFPSQSDENVFFLTLSWMGQKKVLPRVPEDFVHGFELIATNPEKGVQVILEEKEKYLSNYPNLELVLNSLGYFYLNKDEIQEAIYIFRLNTTLFPGSYNTYDSLGEALLKLGEKDAAIENYKKSLELNPKNSNAKDMIENLTTKD